MITRIQVIPRVRGTNNPGRTTPGRAIFYELRLSFPYVFDDDPYSLDLDAKLLGDAEQACRDHPNFHAILGDARELPKQIEEPADFVFIANTFHGVLDKSGLSRAVHEALKPGGRFAIVNWHQHSREEPPVLGQTRGPDAKLRMNPEEVQKEVEPTRFTLEKAIDVGPYHYGVVFLK